MEMMMTTNMMTTTMMILREWLTLSQPGPQPDDPLDPPGKDAPRVPHHDDDEDDDGDDLPGKDAPIPIWGTPSISITTPLAVTKSQIGRFAMPFSVLHPIS